ncbi:DUF2272 domain-containing protein [Lysobacter sp. GX 14042]|uniref:DUF2272 domain-containing protein n=1 Tax=Lysobacter sp. GX 14042 TaxID=2907155 RepID=UPI001F3A6D2E|nr:DUF2272 domain-containing protein [Lysobacter sp. GX 14042]MCE7031824.1 DUF2272 domain-containing protein [Lysobacter sp. GX 14042]
MRKSALAALAVPMIVAALLPGARAQEAGDTPDSAPDSAIPVFERPVGSADPARRVRLLEGDERPALRARLGMFAEPLYRRLPDGRYAEIPVATWQVLDGGCRRVAGDPRQRMIDLAAAEWAAFGLPVLDLSAGQDTAVPQATGEDGFRIIDPARNFSVGERAGRRAAQLGLMEDAPAVDAAIAGYWSAVPGGEDVLRRQAIVEFGVSGAGWATAWSGAFVSWLACEAGVPGFRRSGLHHDYVLQAVDAREGAPGPFIAHDLDEVVPAPGDLLCTARAGSEFTGIADLRTGAGGSRAMHCDLVVATEPAARRLYAIGGNVANAVSLTVVATDDAGRPRPQAELPGAHRWFSVLRPRMAASGTPGLDRSPAVLGLFQAWRRWAARTGNPAPAPLRATAPSAPGAAVEPPSTGD